MSINLNTNVKNNVLLDNFSEPLHEKVQRRSPQKKNSLGQIKSIHNEKSLDESKKELDKRKVQRAKIGANNLENEKKETSAKYPIDIRNLTWHGLEVLEVVEPYSVETPDENNLRRNYLDDALPVLADFLVQKPDWKALLPALHAAYFGKYKNRCPYSERNIIQWTIKLAMNDFVHTSILVQRRLDSVNEADNATSNIGLLLWKKIRDVDTKIGEASNVEETADAFIQANGTPEICRNMPERYRNMVIRGILFKNLISEKETLSADILRWISLGMGDPIITIDVENNKIVSVTLYPMVDSDSGPKRIHFQIAPNGDILSGTGVTGYGLGSGGWEVSSYIDKLRKALPIVRLGGRLTDLDDGLKGVSNINVLRSGEGKYKLFEKFGKN